MEPETKTTKRQIAYKIKIKDIIDGEYIREEGEWTPNYIIINNKHVSRVNLIGAVIAISEQNRSFIINDGTESITIRSFEEKNFDVSIGDIVVLIGRPREFNNEKYIVPEIIKKINNNKWIEVRRLELQLEDLCNFNFNLKNAPNNKITQTEIITENDNVSEKIFKLIRETDKGDGADIQHIISLANINEAENIIKSLLKEGEIFEIRPGKLKVLE